MNNRLILAVVIILLLLVGGWYFLSSKKGTPRTVTSTDNTSESQESQLADGTGSSMKDLLTSGIAQTCTFNVSDESYTSEGKVYVSGGKMRGDFSTTVGGKPQYSHMIVDGETSYVWVDGQTQGFKMEFGEEAKASAEVQSDQNSIDVNAKYNYDCQPGIVSSSNFDLPANVKFVSLTEMMGEYQDQVSSQCASCDSLTGDSKTQCLTLLKCN